MAVVDDVCEGTDVGYTGVDSDGEFRDCARCMQTVWIDPDDDTVKHVEGEK